MKEKYFTIKDFLYSVLASLLLGALFAFIQNGRFLTFSFIFLLSIALLKIAHNWSKGVKTLNYVIALAFFLRFIVGVTLHLALPIYGYADADDRFGYVFTDAHTRDNQAWKLATSEHLIVDALSSKYSSDQY